MLNFNEIYAKEKQNVVNYINWKLNSICDAEEVANDVFAKVAKHFNSYDEKKSPFAVWLRTITNRCIIDFYRTDHTNHYTCVSDFVNAETGSETFDFVSGTSSEANFRVENSEMHRKIRKALRNLKPQYKKIALLYFVQDLKYEEIAEICDVPMGTVKGMISRCREQLQSELKGQYFCRRKQYEIAEEI